MEKDILTVSQLTEEIRILLEDGIGFVTIQGEISNYKLHGSGHRYFTLKDDKAQISCTMWRSVPINFEPSNGLKVIIKGNLTVYEPQGRYQIECLSMSPIGKGDLYLAFEALKKKLDALGYFDPVRKKKLPEFITSVGVATSPSGAAVQDIFSTIGRRLPLCKIYFRPTLVQGEDASADIVKAINELQEYDIDVIIIGRGGGSIEDLWCFNTESVADAIYKCKLPVISAVGHETDFSISDFVADVRAATPTAAAELVTPFTISNLYDILDNYQNNFVRIINQKLADYTNLVNNYADSYAIRRFSDKIKTLIQFTDESESRLIQSLTKYILRKKHDIDALESHIRSLQPLNPLKKGFALLQSEGKYINVNETLGNYINIDILRLKETAVVHVDKIMKSKYKL